MDEDRVTDGGPTPAPADFPYRSPLLANLSALILLWESPVLQGQILARSGEPLDQPAHQTLRHLLAWGPLRPTALAGTLGIGASYISKIVGRLEGDGLVRRTTDPSDRRASPISLTEAGEAAARGVYTLGDRMVAEVLDGWSEDDVRRYTDLTERFVADAVEAAGRMRERGLLPPKQ
jgi:DNA-binding MarR family transcriptional regulator